VEDTFEGWVTNRFGDRVFRTFFKSYTEKVWGIRFAAALDQGEEHRLLPKNTRL
jgi:UDP-galactopyranose mutase